MMKMRYGSGWVIGLMLLTLTTPVTGLAEPHGNDGAVFVMTGSTDPARGNEVAMYRRDRSGDLTLLGFFPTGRLEANQPQFGAGPSPTTTLLGIPVPATADGHGSSNSLLLGENRRCLFAVNAGSNTVSSFEAERDRLRLASVVDSRGGLGARFPVSIAVSGSRVYVLNSGDVGSVVGFDVRHECELTPIPGAARSLAGIADSFPFPEPGEVLTTPGQISFSPDGRRLVVSIKGGDVPGPGFLPNGRMAVFPVGAGGQLGNPTVTPFDATAGRGGPFSFLFTDNHTLFVTHANSQSVGTYRINANNTLSLLSGPLLTGGLAPCWLDRKDDFVVVASFGGIPLVGAVPDGNGRLDVYRLNRDGTAGSTGKSFDYPAPGPGRSGNHAIDVRVAGDFLYFVQPRVGQVGRVTIERTGALTEPATFGGFAEGVEPFAGLNPGINDFLTRCFLQDADADNRSPECRRGSPQGIAGF